MSRQRIAASRALEILQNFPSNCSDNDGADSEIDPVVNAALANVSAVESDKSDSDNEADDQVTHSVVQGGPGLIQGRDESKWRKIAVSSAAKSSLQSHNILPVPINIQPVPKSQYSACTYIIFHKSC